MKKTKLLICSALLFFSLLSLAFKQEKTVGILISENASQSQIFIANRLSDYLSYLYPNYHFKITHNADKNPTIKMGLYPDLFNDETLAEKIPMNDEGFLILKNNDNQVSMVSRTEKGLFNATYSLLEKLGYKFYLSFDSKPEPKKQLSFDEWNMTDFPLQKTRMVFNWHNFLSGCTGWNYEDWKSWIDQSAKMRYNAIMVHAYGNNPMFSFEYNGLKKDVGYLNTSNSGRDWGAQHINDIRRLPGGEIFDQAVFGSDAALVPDTERANAATQLMQKVFQYADTVKMNIIFAVDVDTWSSNPKNIIETLPPDCRIKLRTQDIVNPETPDGYQYYKAQVNSLLQSYPQITNIAVWRRTNGTLWMNITPEEFPSEWANEWIVLLKKYPELKTDKYAAGNFATSKIVVAFQKALDELNRSDIGISYGSWHWDFMNSANTLLPENVAFIPLDWAINFETESTQNILAQIGAKRSIIPVVWAHHDDHRYIGKPYLPYKNFETMLEERNASGFGIIHWTTHPLDLYFKSLIEQTWHNSKNRPLEETVSEFCYSVFGSKQDALLNYMNEWITNGPMFGRETSDHFMDLVPSEFGDTNETLQKIFDGSKHRIDILARVNQNLLSNDGKKLFNYFSQIEQYYMSFSKNQQKLYTSDGMLKRGSLDSAKTVLSDVDPEEAIKLYVKASSYIGMTKGEKAIVISMGTRWLPDFTNLKQIAGMTDIPIKFGLTKHDALAQSPGKFTYYIDEHGKMWKCLGEKELIQNKKNNINNLSFESNETSKSWVSFANQLSIPLQTIGNKDILPGEYSLKLNFEGTSFDYLSFELENEKNIIPLEPINKEKSTIEIRVLLKDKGTYNLGIKNKGSNSVKLFSLVINPLSID